MVYVVPDFILFFVDFVMFFFLVRREYVTFTVLPYYHYYLRKVTGMK